MSIPYNSHDNEPSGPHFGYQQRIALHDIRLWGGPTSNAILDERFRYFTHPGIDGMIGYFSNDRHIIALGDPITDPAHRIPLAASFQNHCQHLGKSFMYAIASETFAHLSLENGCQAFIGFCEELVLDPRDDPTVGSKGRLLRRKLRHSANSGVSIYEYKGYDEILETRLCEIGQLWLQKRRGPQIHISQVHLFENRFGKRWFYARRGSSLVGVLVLSELKANRGWLINHLMSVPGENGVTELLVISALNILAKEGCHLLSIGIMPAHQIGRMTGLNPITEAMVRSFYKVLRKIFSLESKRKYWEKFSPKKHPAYLVLDRPKLSLRSLISLARILNVSL